MGPGRKQVTTLRRPGPARICGGEDLQGETGFFGHLIADDMTGKGGQFRSGL